MTGTIVAIGGLAVGCVVVEKVLIALGKIDMAQIANVSAYSLGALTALTLIAQLFTKVKSIF